MGNSAPLTVAEPAVPVDDGVYHVVRFIRAGANATLQVRTWLPDVYGPIFRSYVFGPSGF